MNSPEDFDDLARRKLEERTFPFDEGHWHAMQRVLAEERRRKRRGLYWGLAAGLLLLIGGGMALLTGRDATSAPSVAQVNEGAPTDGKQADHATATAPVDAQPRRTENAATATGTTTTQEQPDAARPATNATPTSAQARANAPATRTTTPEDRSTRKGGSTSKPHRTDAAPANNGDRASAPAAQQALPATTPPPVVIAGGAVAATAQGAPPPVANTGDEGLNGQDAGAQAQAGDAAGASADTSRTAPPNEQGPLAAGGIAAAGGDSLNSPTTTPVAPPIVPTSSPWELTVWGGAQRTHTVYSGAETPWSGTITDANAPAFGAEVMHMGRNLGLGAGLHYITYAERYQQPLLYTDVTAIDPVYTVIAVDTSLMIVTGSYTQNGQVYYTTQLMDTTVYVLDIGADTTITRITTQQAVDRVNQVSYLEIPLFLDGHVDAGRWRFGLRGGPTVGLLTGRQGTVPISDPMGTMDLNDQPFRSTMLGWTARGYVRYRLGDRWWLGLEPMARGQLLNAYSTGALDRRSTGLGIGFSVSFRLP